MDLDCTQQAMEVSCFFAVHKLLVQRLLKYATQMTDHWCKTFKKLKVILCVLHVVYFL